MSNIIIPIITGIVCLAVGVIIGFLYRKSAHRPFSKNTKNRVCQLVFFLTV